jgi:amidase
MADQIDCFAPATEMLRALRARQVSAVELLDMHLGRIARYNPALNAIVTPNYEQARLAARVADEARARGEDAALLGLPLTIKDCIYLEGLPTTGGVPERATLIDEADAPVAARVRAAGAVIMGKTNVPPYAADWQSDNPIFGRSNNPWDLDRTPGGSTGGGAAAVAAGLAALEFGGDFGGSIRIPSSFCGIYGHKSSENAVPRTGHFPGGLEPNTAVAMAVQGPLALSAEDLDLALGVIAGPDVYEDVAYRIALPPPRHERLADFRVAVLPLVDWLPVDEEILAAQERLADGLRRLGASVATAAPEGFGDMRRYYRTYIAIMAAISEAGRPREERLEDAAKIRAHANDDQNLYWAEGMVGDAADYIGWFGRRAEYRAAYRAFFRAWDVLLAPTNIVTAFPHTNEPYHRRGFTMGGREIGYGFQSFYPGLCNLSGQPGTAFPAGCSREGLPIGLQAIGPYHEDRTTIRFAGLVGREFGGFAPPPGYA